MLVTMPSGRLASLGALAMLQKSDSPAMATVSRWLPVLLLLGGLGGAAVAAAPATVLKLQGVSFKVQVTGEGTEKTVVLQASKGGKTFPAVKTQVLGSISGPEVEDLNSDGQPELLLYVTSSGSGSYGSVLAWSASKGHNLLPITMPELSGKLAKGYMGHDQFAVVETSLMRRFPLYRSGDTNAKPTGGTRQISYKLVAGEAGYQFKPVSETSFSD
jgi:hypothetical protein